MQASSASSASVLALFLIVLLAAGSIVLPACAQMAPYGLPAANSARDPLASATSSIRVQVRGADNHPLSDVRIEVHDLSFGHVIASGYTRPNGVFELDNVPRRTYEIVATKGLTEARRPLDLRFGEAAVDIRLDDRFDNVASAGHSVSVSQLRVPGKARGALRQARKSFEKGKYDESRTKVAKALGLYPNYSDALILKGILDLHDGKPEDARAALERAIALDPGNDLAYLVLGATYNSMGQYDDALRTLQQGASLNPSRWQAHFEMARAYVGKSDYAQALAQLDKAERSAPQKYGPIQLVKAAAYLGLKNISAAVEQLEQYLRNEPKGASAAIARQQLDQMRAFVASNPQ